MKTATVFKQQNGDQSGLQHDQRASERKLPAIPFPCVRLAKVNFASGRKTPLANPPSLQFTPIILWCGIVSRWSFDIACLLSAKNTDRNCSSSSAARKCRVHGT